MINKLFMLLSLITFHSVQMTGVRIIVANGKNGTFPSQIPCHFQFDNKTNGNLIRTVRSRGNRPISMRQRNQLIILNVSQSDQLSFVYHHFVRMHSHRSLSSQTKTKTALIFCTGNSFGISFNVQSPMSSRLEFDRYFQKIVRFEFHLCIDGMAKFSKTSAISIGYNWNRQIFNFGVVYPGAP